MIIKRLRLEGIRSYKKADLEFPLGKTLFSGDIGAGKSTILMAIEFALFGLGNSRASSLLRLGEPRGSVELEFEAKGNDYSVRRVLARKGSSVQQVEGRLRGPQGEDDYPATELKERILGILNFREPVDPKARSLIFQYAIYTPQEEMKAIIALGPSDRLSILRRAFGVDEYKLAMENATELVRKIREKRTRFEGAAAEVHALKREVADLDAKASKGDGELVGLDGSEREQEAALRQLETEKQGLHELEVQLASASKEREHTGREALNLKREADSLSAEAEGLERKERQLSSTAKSLGAPPSEKTVRELKVVLSSVREDITRHRASDVEMGTKIGQYESVAAKGRCPVCDREASAEEFAVLVSSLSTEKEKNSSHLERLETELSKTEELLDRVREYDSLLAKAKDDAALASDYRDEVLKKRDRLATVREGLAVAEKKQSELDDMVKVLKGETKGLEVLSKKIDSTQSDLKATRERAASLRSDVRKWREDAKQRADSIARKEKFAAKAISLGEREIWLEEFFVPTLESIERHVMTSINREFGACFQKWFGVLVEDSGKESRVDEDFTPMVDQDGYEQDVEFLSGGERTSVALAYRLALSQMVQKFADAGASSLILDEPTDGFSKEQLGKVREILDEIANPQVIIVSHERELESFADQVYHVAKADGESKITR